MPQQPPPPDATAPPDDVVASYQWVKSIEAWTVAVIDGATTDQVIRTYGGDPASPVGDYTFAQMRDLQQPGDPSDEDLRFHVQVFQVGSQVVTLENNGWTGAIPEIARRLSTGAGQFFSVYWNVNGFGLLLQAIDGTVTAYFEMLYPLAPQARPGARRPAWAIGPEIDVEVAPQTCMAFLQAHTGVAVDQRWLGEPRATYRIPDPDAMLSDVDNPDKL
jgi:hypothetical protein